MESAPLPPGESGKQAVNAGERDGGEGEGGREEGNAGERGERGGIDAWLCRLRSICSAGGGDSSCLRVTNPGGPFWSALSLVQSHRLFRLWM